MPKEKEEKATEISTAATEVPPPPSNQPSSPKPSSQTPASWAHPPPETQHHSPLRWRCTFSSKYQLSLSANPSASLHYLGTRSVKPDKRIPMLIFSIYLRLIARSLSLLELHPELPWQTYGQEGLLSWQVDWRLTCCRFGLWLRLPSAPNSPYRPRSERLILHPLMNRNFTAQTIPRTENFVARSDLRACDYLSWRDFHT